MSTRLLQTMIEAHRQGTSVSIEAICEAERELAAIREAAKAFHEWNSWATATKERALALATLTKIAQEE